MKFGSVVFSPALVAGICMFSALACQGSSQGPAQAPGSAGPDHRHPEETHFKELLQLTDGGENAEAYWAFGGNQLIFQAHEGEGCDQIYTMSADRPLPERSMVSTGKGATTCAYFLPGDQEIVYSSTHLGGDACPPKPDHSKGYVWALYDTYDIFRANADGSNLRPLTTEPGYDAEATVCPVDGSIIFTSVRDGDLELYRMDADGSNVKRLTSTPGYDGGAFFSQDCSKIVWRASRPTGDSLADYQRLLAEGLVRPSKLEIFVANADGSDARQVTYLNAAAFGPFFAPGANRILFSTNAGDPKGREFDIWAVNVDGSELEQITHTPGFDGFPMFSPDGKHLAFSSNRASRPGTYDTNVFVTEWVDHPPKVIQQSAVDRVMKDVRWLADPAREGRGVGTSGLEASGAYVEAAFKEIGLEPAGDDGSFRQSLEVVTEVKSGPGTQLQLGAQALSQDEFQPLGFSAPGAVKGDLVLAGYGIQDESVGRTDYSQAKVKGKVAVVRRFVPSGGAFEETREQRRFGDLRHKAWVAKEQGAKALIVVDAPERPKDAGKDYQPAAEASFPSLSRSGYGDAGIPVVIVSRAAFADTLAKLEKKQRVPAQIRVDLSMEKAPVFNVLGKLPAQAENKLPGTLVIGAHYDHLGMGGESSLAPGDHSAHVGADDNASGVALVLEVARRLKQEKSNRRDIVFAAFTAEEMGILGSSHLVKNPPAGLEAKDVYAMFNFDMVGRMTDNSVSVLGGESATEWKDIVPDVCTEARVTCSLSGSGYGPSDHSAFYAAGVPVLHFFTGAHSDYHKPSDVAELVNGAGLAQLADVTARLASLEEQPQKLTYNKLPPEDPRGDLRSFNASLGTIPDYAGPPGGQKGVLLSGVRPGSAAQLGGLQRGDILVKLGARDIESVHDLMYALNEHKPNETVTATVQREGKPVSMKVTFQERGAARGDAAQAHGAAAQAHGAAAAHGGAAHGAASHGAHDAKSAHGANPHGAPNPHAK